MMSNYGGSYSMRNNQEYDANMAQVNQNCPKLQDSIQEITWYPVPNNYIFACATWEGTIRFYSFLFGQNNSYGVDFAQGINVTEPAICCAFREDGQKLYTGLANGQLIEIDIQSKQTNQTGQHDLGIRNVYWHQTSKCVISVGFDKCIRFWDVLQPSNKSVFEYKCDNIPMVSAMYNNNFIFADNEQKIWQGDWERLRNMNQSYTRSLFTSSSSNLGDRSQITALDINQKYIAVGSIDGRVNILEQQKYDTKHVILFKAQKTEEQGTYTTSKKQIMWPVTNLEMNPHRALDNFLYTTGSNGDMHFWDFKEKNKIKTKSFQGAITASKLSPDGTIIAYATGYDWNRGMEMMGKTKNELGAYVVQNQDLFYSR